MLCRVVGLIDIVHLSLCLLVVGLGWYTRQYKQNKDCKACCVVLWSEGEGDTTCSCLFSRLDVPGQRPEATGGHSWLVLNAIMQGFVAAVVV